MKLIQWIQNNVYRKPSLFSFIQNDLSNLQKRNDVSKDFVQYFNNKIHLIKMKLADQSIHYGA